MPSCKSSPSNLLFKVPTVGLEPTHPCGYQILSLARLPIPPRRLPCWENLIRFALRSCCCIRDAQKRCRETCAVQIASMGASIRVSLVAGHVSRKRKNRAASGKRITRSYTALASGCREQATFAACAFSTVTSDVNCWCRRSLPSRCSA